jgi:nucleoside-diphosphate-sugar epimerase
MKYIQGDIRNYQTCVQAMHGVSEVIHLAAMSRSGPSLDKWEECISTNVNGTANVLKASHEHQVHRFIYAGSSTFYGNKIGLQKVEDRGDFLNFYGLTKYFGEELTTQFRMHFNMSVAIMRYFNVYGPGQPTEGAYGLVMGIFCDAALTNRRVEIHGDGQQRRDFIHVKDVARANVMALESTSIGNTFNIGSGKNTSVLELANLFKLEYSFGPRRTGDAEETLADISNTRSILGWNPEIKLEDGIATLLDINRNL